MAYWHEINKDDGGWIILPKPGSRVAVEFRGFNVRVEPFRGRFLRYEGAEKLPQSINIIPHWKKNPEGWFELWPVEPLLASSMDEAKAKYLPLLPLAEDGSAEERFEKRPYQPPTRPQFVKEIEHATHHAKARILRYSDDLFSVVYLVYAPNGKYLPASTPSISADLDYEWGVTYEEDENSTPLQTMADNLFSAEEIAAIELEKFVAEDPETKLR